MLWGLSPELLGRVAAIDQRLLQSLPRKIDEGIGDALQIDE